MTSPIGDVQGVQSVVQLLSKGFLTHTISKSEEVNRLLLLPVKSGQEITILNRLGIQCVHNPLF